MKKYNNKIARTKKALRLLKLSLRSYGVEKYITKHLACVSGYNRRNNISFVRKRQLDDVIHHVKSVIVPKKEHLIAPAMINFKQSIESRCGLRHIKHLPVRGQRSKTNARTALRKILK
jgi:small subunit ribosomal protein S13